MKTVYLAGPISDLDWRGATGWRDDAIQALGLWGIKGLSPMRGKDYLRDVNTISRDCREPIYTGSPLSTPRGIMTRDFYDATRSDAIIAYLTGSERVSIGTCMEIAWGFQARVPVIAVMEPGSVHDHAMINEAVGYVVKDLHEAIHVTRLLLGVEGPLEDVVGPYSVRRAA